MASEEYLQLLQDVRVRAQIRLKEITDEAATLHITKNAGYAGKDNPDHGRTFGVQSGSD